MKVTQEWILDSSAYLAIRLVLQEESVAIKQGEDIVYVDLKDINEFCRLLSEFPNH